MASTPIKIKRIPRPTHKAKIVTRLTSSISGSAPIVVTRTGLVYNVSLDSSTFPSWALASPLVQGDIFFAAGPEAIDKLPAAANGVLLAGVTPTWGTASIEDGGTGATTLTANGVLVGNGTDAITATAAGAIGAHLTGMGASADPAFVLGVINVKAYGATGDGVTDDTTALNAARVAIQALGGGVLYFPEGTYLLSTSTALGFTAGHIVVEGDGEGSIIKAKDNALVGAMVTANCSSFYCRHITLDGNKANDGLDTTVSYGAVLQSDNSTLDHVVIQNCVRTAIALSSGVENTEIQHCIIRDNEVQGLTYIGAAPVGLWISHCKFQRNYNTTAIADSSAINLGEAYNVTVTDCEFEDNYNINGGQVEIGDGGDGTGEISVIFSNNKVWQTGTVAGENTFGVAFYGSHISCTGNQIGRDARSVTGPGIVIGGDGNHFLIEGNQVWATGVGISATTGAGVVGVSNATIRNNDIFDGSFGIGIQRAAPSATIIVKGNRISTAITAFDGAANATIYPDNYGTSTATAGAVSVSTGGILSSGTLAVAYGGTGQPSYSVGDILYASAATTLAKLNDVATGNALISGGVTTAPLWGKIGLTTHISGTLAVGNGGTGIASGTSGGIPYFSAASTIASSAALTANAIVKGGGAGAAPVASGVSIDASNNVSAVANLTTTGLTGLGGATAGDFRLKLSYNGQGGINGVDFVDASTTGTNTAARFVQNAAAVGSITTTNSVTAYNTSSDKDLKTDERAFTRSGEIIDNLKVWDFAWRINPGARGVGVFAQDAHKVFPDAITPSDTLGGWQADYSKFVPVLLAELKALRARVAALEQG